MFLAYRDLQGHLLFALGSRPFPSVSLLKRESCHAEPIQFECQTRVYNKIKTINQDWFLVYQC